MNLKTINEFTKHITSLGSPFMEPRSTIWSIRMPAIQRLIDASEEEITQIEHIALLNRLEVDVRKIVRRKTLRKLLSQRLNPFPNKSLS